MWSLIATVLGILAKLFGVGQPDPVAQGEKMGESETKAATDEAVLTKVSDAEEARRDQRAGDAVTGVRGPDEFSRD